MQHLRTHHAHTHMYARTYVHTSIYVCSQEMTVTVAKASYIASYTHIHYTKSSSTLLLFQTRPPIAVCMHVCTTVLSTLTYCAWDTRISRKCHDCWWIAMLWLLGLVLWGLYLHLWSALIPKLIEFQLCAHVCNRHQRQLHNQKNACVCSCITSTVVIG